MPREIGSMPPWDRVAARYHDELYPAIERVWNDGITSIRADLREWLRRMTEEPTWVPSRFELAFGLDSRDGRDPASVDEPVRTSIGLALRGSIDLVESSDDGRVRATDHKSGKAKIEAGSIIAGGTTPAADLVCPGARASCSPARTSRADGCTTAPRAAISATSRCRSTMQRARPDGPSRTR